MRRLLLGLALVLCATEGRAGFLHCSFTEPFFILTFDSATHKVMRVSADVVDDKDTQVASVVSKHARLERTIGEGSAQTFELTDGKRVILTLRLDGRGSDGMSEKIYAFSAEYDHQQGACETRKYPSWDFDDIVGDLGMPR